MVGLGSLGLVWQHDSCSQLTYLYHSYLHRYLPYAPPPYSEMMNPRGGHIYEFISDVYEASYWSNSFIQPILFLLLR